jgi:hypothetical protein
MESHKEVFCDLLKHTNQKLRLGITYVYERYDKPSKPLRKYLYTKLNPKKGYCYSNEKVIINREFFDSLEDDEFKYEKNTNNCVSCWKESINNYYKYSSIRMTHIPILENSLLCSVSYSFKLFRYQTGNFESQFQVDDLYDWNLSWKGCATMLIYPPKSITGHTFKGGDLVFQIDGQEHRIKPSEFVDDYVCVIFGKIPYKCEPITEGTMYLIKGCINSKLPNILSSQTQIAKDIMDIESNQEDFINYINTQSSSIKDSIDKIVDEFYNKKIEYVKDNLPDNLYDTHHDESRDDDRYENFEYKVLLYNYNNLNNYKQYNQIGDINFDEDKYNICMLPFYIGELNNYKLYPKSFIDYVKQLINSGWKINFCYDTINTNRDSEESYNPEHIRDSSLLSNGYKSWDDTYHDYINIMNYNDNYQYGKMISYSREGSSYIDRSYECLCMIVYK